MDNQPHTYNHQPRATMDNQPHTYNYQPPATIQHHIFHTPGYHYPDQIINFFVPGNPAPQGSKRHIGRGVMVESCKTLGPWRERIAIAAHNATLNSSLLAGPINVRLQFIMPRPKSTPKKTTPPAIKRPDIDKLVRACLDAITNVIIEDDSQIVELHATKHIAEPGQTPGAQITITTKETP